MDKLYRNITIIEEKARNIRINNELSQAEFGKILGVSKSFISNIENGYNPLTIDQINKICNYADVSFDYMFDFCKEINKNIIKIEKINLKVLGNNLKEVRKELNYTQEKLAQKLNITRSLITHYERGNRTIRTADLKQMCELSGYSADWFIGKLKDKLKIKLSNKLKAEEFKELISQ